MAISYKKVLKCVCYVRWLMLDVHCVTQAQIVYNVNQDFHHVDKQQVIIFS